MYNILNNIRIFVRYKESHKNYIQHNRTHKMKSHISTIWNDIWVIHSKVYRIRLWSGLSSLFKVALTQCQLINHLEYGKNKLVSNDNITFLNTKNYMILENLLCIIQQSCVNMRVSGSLIEKVQSRSKLPEWAWWRQRPLVSQNKLWSHTYHVKIWTNYVVSIASLQGEVH